MKKIIKKFAIWLLDLLDEQELQRMKIDYKTSIDWSKYLAKKDKWYHLAMTSEVFLMRSDKDKQTISQIAVYVDGKLRSKHLI